MEDTADQIDDQVDQNSWGGSQYDPPDELDKVEDTTQEPTNDPALEDDAGDEVRMSSMRTVQMGTMHIVPEGEQQVRFQAMRTVFLSNVWRKTPVGKEQPTRSRQLQATLTAEIEINGVKALTLFDTGSTTDSVTPEFASTTKAKTFKLEEQVIAWMHG